MGRFGSSMPSGPDTRPLQGRSKACYLSMKGSCGFRCGGLKPGYICESRLGAEGLKGRCKELPRGMLNLMWHVYPKIGKQGPEYLQRSLARKDRSWVET